MKKIKIIKYKKQIIAIVIKKDYRKEGIEFFSPPDFSQQLGYMQRPKGYQIQPHVHLLHDRKVRFTQETLVIKKGKVKVNFYTPERKYFKSIILKTGDIILLASAGHGLEFLEKSEIVEIKQGPYSEKKDKIKF